MESFGDYIYIFVMLAAIIGGMLTNKKKKEEAERESLPPFPDLSDVLSEERDQEFVYAESETTFQEIVAEKFQAMQSNFEEVESQMYSASLSEDMTGKINDCEDETWLSDISLEDINEAQKAFIYSEIMMRKYF